MADDTAKEITMLTRRQFAIGSVAMTSAGIIGRRIVEAGVTHFNTPLPIPRLVDAAKQGNAVSLKIAAGRHAFVHGNPARTYGLSAAAGGLTTDGAICLAAGTDPFKLIAIVSFS